MVYTHLLGDNQWIFSLEHYWINNLVPIYYIQLVLQCHINNINLITATLFYWLELLSALERTPIENMCRINLFFTHWPIILQYTSVMMFELWNQSQRIYGYFRENKVNYWFVQYWLKIISSWKSPSWKAKVTFEKFHL